MSVTSGAGQQKVKTVQLMASVIVAIDILVQLRFMEKNTAAATDDYPLLMENQGEHKLVVTA